MAFWDKIMFWKKSKGLVSLTTSAAIIIGSLGALNDVVVKKNAEIKEKIKSVSTSVDKRQLKNHTLVLVQLSAAISQTINTIYDARVFLLDFDSLLRQWNSGIYSTEIKDKLSIKRRQMSSWHKSLKSYKNEMIKGYDRLNPEEQEEIQPFFNSATRQLQEMIENFEIYIKKKP